jgi:hypothetical protein
MDGSTEKGIENFNRMLEGKRHFVSSRRRWKNGQKEIGYGDVWGGVLVRLAEDWPTSLFCEHGNEPVGFKQDAWFLYGCVVSE